MPMLGVELKPGVDTQLTFSENVAGLVFSNLVRYKENQVQKIGGWSLYFNSPVSTSPVRDIHAFQGLNSVRFVGIGSLTNLTILSCGVLRDITPQTRTIDSAPNFTISSGSPTVTVSQSGANAATYDSVYFNTPVAIGNIILLGGYQVASVIDSTSYTITSSINASTTITSSGILPKFQTVNGSAVVQVTFPGNGYQQIVGLFYPFTAPTTIGGLTIQGPYEVSTIIDSSTFTITTPRQATSGAGPSSMNGGQVEIVYYITSGPPQTEAAYGGGLYGAGVYGLGTTSLANPGTPLTATDWTLDNWGEVLLACPKGGGIYTWSADQPLGNAQIIANAPFFNGGIFVSMPQQILVAWASGQVISGVQDPLLVRWSDSSNYNQWTVISTTQAGFFHIPTGSTCVAGGQGPLFGLIWTDVDVWMMQYVGQPIVFGFTRVGSGCGALGPHAFDFISGLALWAGNNNFFATDGTGVRVLACTVWDYFFQQLDQTNKSKVRCASNAVFNEVSWFFPVIGGTGENTNYVKLHLNEGGEHEWDFGVLNRTAWIDVTAIGNPLGTDSQGFIYQHETSPDAAGTAINAAFETGWFALSEGNDLAFVDWLLPDMLWATYPKRGIATATVLFTFYVVDYLGDTAKVFGPYSVTQATQFINVRFRGRFMRFRCESQDTGSFWSIGKLRLRWSVSGRR